MAVEDEAEANARRGDVSVRTRGRDRGDSVRQCEDQGLERGHRQ